ncbi:magnesium transporter [Aliidiomarina quisquiliarum]|uniref:magnesium transporter n=1 Tax=Aliidiomarina quisquiliarum TaxID=2938947 RepID=UPI00208EC0FF|nr:magnesium transporter [Aliidiomarina quisquiliarum]MCO4320039.1 magnesium transporter [Aliidiomarina quisquiliarum]
MNGNDLHTVLRQLLNSADQIVMSSLLTQHHRADIGAAIAEFSAHEVCDLLQLMGINERVKIFSHLTLAKQSEVASAMTSEPFVELFLNMLPDERADLFNTLTPAEQSIVMSQIALAEREDIWRLASYKENEAGSVMTSDYVQLGAALTAVQAIALLQETAADKEIIYQAYIVNDTNQLIGTISLRDLIVAESSAKVTDLMTKKPISVRAEAPPEIAAQLISKYDLIALPVVNNDGKMLGIITHDDAMDIAAEEASEDFHKTGAVGSLVGNIKEASIRMLYQKRVFWLVLLVFGNIFSGAGIAYFEDTISAYIALVFFLPLLVDSGGNAGSQSATLMVRALGTGEVHLKDWASMLGREFIVAGLLGLTMAAAVSVLGVWRGGMEIAIVVALTMQIIVIVGSVIGMSLPFVLSRFNMDPASASAPLITSIADGAGVIIYFSIATWLLDLPVAG